MINQPEECPLSRRSAVQFDHKGKQFTDISSKRQGRRRFAKIVDTESASRGRSAVRSLSGS